MSTIDRNARARLLFRAERLDCRTHQPGQHGGIIKRTGIAVFKALLGYASSGGGFCCPAYETIAKAAGVARSSVGTALARLEAAGLVERIRRQHGPVRLSNAYRLKIGAEGRADGPLDPKGTASSERRPERTTYLRTNPKNATIMPRVLPWVPDETRPETRAYLKQAREILRRRRREREAGRFATG